MKRSTQHIAEDEKDTTNRRGQRQRKPTAKLMENMSLYTIPSAPMISDGKKSTGPRRASKQKESKAYGNSMVSALAVANTAASMKFKYKLANSGESINGNNLEDNTSDMKNNSLPNENSLRHHSSLSMFSMKQNKDLFELPTFEHDEKNNSNSCGMTNLVLESQMNPVLQTPHLCQSNQTSCDNVMASNRQSVENIEPASDVFLSPVAQNKLRERQEQDVGSSIIGGQLDISETYITIETKDGLSSEKIPFSQFLKKVEIDKESGNLKVDLNQLLVPCSSSRAQLENEISKAGKQLVKISSSSVSGCPVVNSSSDQQDTFDAQSKSLVVQRPLPKRRGRPPKQKQMMQSSGNVHEHDKIPSSVHSSSPWEPNNSESVSALLSFNETSMHTQGKVAHDFSYSPRRSRRTPAKNSRFGEDFVDSITLGKVTSSSSSWNTQLMTLALAAERHKNKPQKMSDKSSNSGEPEQTKDKNVAIFAKGKDSERKESSTEDSNSDVDFREGSDEASRQTGQKRFISIQSYSSRSSSDERGRKVAGVGLKGPKTLKKYEPVDPVVRRSLQEAFKISLDSTAELLSTETPVLENNDNQKGSLYYIIMEPKMDALGHGLLIEKSEDKMNFKIVNFSGNLPCNADLNKFSTSYPQDRYFSCDLCDKIFSSSSSWLQHNKFMHNRTIDSFEGPVSNTADRAKHTCEYCEQSFPYKFMLDIHIKRKRHSEIKTFRCTLCKESFATHKAREEHWMMSHPARSCGLCGKQFTNIVMLRRHINYNCHGARFRKTVGSSETNAEDNMVVLQESTNSADKEPNENFENTSEYDDLEEVIKETDVEVDYDDDDNDESNSNQVKGESGKVKCDICDNEFSTYSGLWYHKLDIHHEFYPQGFKEKLKEKLEKNQSILLTAQEAELQKAVEGSKNKFFVLLKPKWPSHQAKLVISVDEKEFTFKPCDEKFGAQESLPHNSYADVPTKKETSFRCSQCGEIFQFASNYREHRSRVHGECFEVLRLLGAFQCTLCSETYPCQFMLDKHLKKHVGKKLLPCTLCGFYFHKIQERRLHWKTAHPGIGCPNCGKMYASIKYLQKHISLNCQDHFPPTKKFLEFQKKQHSDFEMPKSEKKVEKKIIQCHLCPKLCSSVHGWRRHMSESHEDSGFSKLSNTCIICNELVYGYKALEKHLLENHAVESGLPVEEEDGMVEEALKKSEMDISTYRKAGRNNNEIFQDEEGNFHCPTCPKTHPDIRALRTHIRTHINMNLECSVCNKTFKNPTLLKQHVQRHRKDAVYTCDTCNKKFLTLQKLNKHRKVHHSTGSFVCELCGMSFALNDYLQKHKRCHTDKRPHCCTVCGKTFRTKPELRVHVLIHTRETPYKCQYCTRGFSQKGNYRIHLAQHTGEKPYQCDQCEISFALLCHLKRHKITHDQKINYRCIWCDKECTQRKHMQMHVQRVHKEDFFQYEEQMKLETPIPIAPSQVKLYNRRLGKMNKVRKQYRTRAQKCDSTIQQLMNGVVTKTEPMDEDTETSQNIVIEPIVEPMIETVSCDMPVTSHENGSLEILVSEDHQNYAKQSITADLLGQDSSNVEIVMGENNEINIIIKDPSALHEVMGGQADLGQLASGPVQMHESLQQAVEALVTHARGMEEEDGQESLVEVNELDKSASIGTDVLS